MTYGRWQCVCGAQFSSAHPFKQWWHRWWYGHGDDNYYLVPKGMTAAEYRAQVQRELAEQKERDDAAQREVDRIVHSTRKSAIRFREQDRAISAFKMSRETHRRLVVIGNLKPQEPGEIPINTLWGIPIIFDEDVPAGEVKEMFK